VGSTPTPATSLLVRVASDNGSTLVLQTNRRGSSPRRSTISSGKCDLLPTYFMLTLADRIRRLPVEQPRGVQLSYVNPDLCSRRTTGEDTRLRTERLRVQILPRAPVIGPSSNWRGHSPAKAEISVRFRMARPRKACSGQLEVGYAGFFGGGQVIQSWGRSLDGEAAGSYPAEQSSILCGPTSY
jgi:hypothetical protein